MKSSIKSTLKFPLKAIWYSRNRGRLKRIMLNVDQIDFDFAPIYCFRRMSVYAYFKPSIRTNEFINGEGITFFDKEYSLSIKTAKPFKRKGVRYSVTHNGKFNIVSYDISHGFGGGESMKIEFVSCGALRKITTNLSKRKRRKN